MLTFVSVSVVPALVSNVPEPLMPPVNQPFDSVRPPRVFMVNTPANVTLPLSVNAPPTFML
jgi:hypothetical protein